MLSALSLHHWLMGRGATLFEVLMVVTVIAIVAGISAPTLGRVQDRLLVGRSRNELVAFYRAARLTAVFRSAQVRVELAPDTLRAVLEGSDSVFLEQPGPAGLGVTLSTSRSVVRFQPTGVGYGAANTTIVLSRGSATDSLATSRLGRIRRIL